MTSSETWVPHRMLPIPCPGWAGLWAGPWAGLLSGLCAGLWAGLWSGLGMLFPLPFSKNCSAARRSTSSSSTTMAKSSSGGGGRAANLGRHFYYNCLSRPLCRCWPAHCPSAAIINLSIVLFIKGSFSGAVYEPNASVVRNTSATQNRLRPHTHKLITRPF